MSRTTQNVVLLLVGLSTAVMLVKGTYLNYVKPGLLWWLIAAAVVLVALGLVAIVRDLRHVNDDGGEGTHDEHRHRAGLGWLLLIPIAMVAFVVPPPMDARGAASPPAATSEPARHPFPQLPPGPAPVLSVPETVMRAAADSAHTLDGRTISLTGFTLHYPDGVDLGRVVIVCCAADAQLARIHLAGPAVDLAAGYPEDTWLQLQGQIQPGSAQSASNFVPTLIVSSVTRVDKPANTYAY
ncbi:MAG TPA: TIGR03943 family protein [Mycobacterium sp.]|nr:TIGR03943 family protein [Mycobacterium sp.]